MQSDPAARQWPLLISGASANNASAIGGGFTFNVNNPPSRTNWNYGCGLSYLYRFHSMPCIILSTRWKLPDKGVG